MPVGIDFIRIDVRPVERWMPRRGRGVVACGGACGAGEYGCRALRHRTVHAKLPVADNPSIHRWVVLYGAVATRDIGAIAFVQLYMIGHPAVSILAPYVYDVGVLG